MSKTKRPRFTLVGFLASSTCAKTRRFAKEKIVEVRKYENKQIKYCGFDSKQIVNGII